MQLLVGIESSQEMAGELLVEVAKSQTRNLGITPKVKSCWLAKQMGRPFLFLERFFVGCQSPPRLANGMAQRRAAGWDL